MKKYSFALLSAFFISALMLFSPATQADDALVDNPQQPSYGEKVGEKALSGFTNINTAFLEIPKNIINTTNDSNVAFGFIGGGVKGILNTVGRLMAGLTDLVTAPLVTLPITQPKYIWDDFDKDTTYGKAFRLDNEPAAVVEVPEPAKEAPLDTSANKARDRLFKEKMMK